MATCASSPPPGTSSPRATGWGETTTSPASPRCSSPTP
jgi:hypothetical protein